MGTAMSFILGSQVSFPLSSWPVMLLCCSGGLIKIVYAFGLGYGLSMTSSGLLALQHHYASSLLSPPEGVSLLAACGVGLYVSYGTRLVWFLQRRQSSAQYQGSNKGKDLDKRMNSTPLPIKVAVTCFVSLVQVACAYALQPIVDKSNTSCMWSMLPLLVGLFGLGLETVADEQKLAAKEAAPNKPCMTGLYSSLKHPNYTGEILFWAGILGASQLSLFSQPAWSYQYAAGCGVGPIMMIWVMMGASKRLDKEGLEKYAKVEGYLDWAKKTPSLFPWGS